MQPQLVDTVASLQSFLEELPCKQQARPNLFIDLEGDDHCRRGTLSLITIFVESRQMVHLIDITTLRGQAFSASDSKGRTLESILESADIVKVFFDIRNDSDALFSHYGIRVRGIEDVQLMELASRTASKRVVNGLAKCIGSNSDISFRERREWSAVKERGQRLFRTGKDGYAIFDRRPLPADVLEYCVQDVTFLPKLRDSYRAKLCNATWLKIQEETLARIVLSQSPSYNGKGRHMALGPPSWQNWHPSLAERWERSLLQEEQHHQEGKQTEKAMASPLQDEKPASNDLNEAEAAVANPTQDVEPASSEANEATTASKTTQDRTSEQELGPIARALQEMMVREDSPHVDESDGLDHFGSGGYSTGFSSGRWSPDYTACDIECGYCGSCGY